MQNIRCASCGGYLGRQEIPSVGWVELYCQKKQCKCHTRVEILEGSMTLCIAEQSQKAFKPLTPALA